MDTDSPADSLTGSAAGSQASANNELAQNYRALRDLLNIGLLGMVVLAASYAYLLLHEIDVAAKQVRQSATQVVVFEREVAPKLKEVASKLDAYSKLHPQFAPIYMKYFGTNTQETADSPVSDPPPVQP